MSMRDLVLRLRADSSDAVDKMRLVSADYDKLKARFEKAVPKIDINSRSALAKMDDISLRMDRLGKKVARPEIDTRGFVRASAEIDRLNAKMDDLKVKQRSFSLGSIGKSLISLGALKGLATGGQASAIGPAWLDTLLSPGGLLGAGTAVTAGAPVIASLIDALAGGAIGAGTAGAGFMGVQKFDARALAPGLSNISRTFSSVFQSIGPSAGMMLANFGKQVQGMAPMLAKLFSASLPFMRAFLILMEQAAKNVLPAMTQAMNTMVRTGALKAMLQGFVALTQGAGRFINAIGPGMKAGAEVFRAVAIAISGILDALGKTLGWLGKYAQTEFHLIATHFDAFRHDVAAIYGGIYHDLLATWNKLWSDTIGAAIRGIHAVEGWFNGLSPNVKKTLSGLGKMLLGIATGALNQFWSGFKSVGGSILSWVKGFASSILNDIKNFFGISSPSRAMWEVGRNIGLGLEQGIKSRVNHIRAAAATMHGAAMSGAPSAAARYARALASRYGWGGQWGSINAVAMRESGWSMTARNPSSGAYGIAQFINGPSEYYQYGGNPNTIAGQVTAFFNYIHQRYGNPNAAWAHELNYGWYDKGGILKKGLTLALNTTGQDEYITRSPGGGGGDVYNIYPPESATNPDAYALTMIQAIRKYKMRHGNAVVGIG